MLINYHTIIIVRLNYYSRDFRYALAAHYINSILNYYRSNYTDARLKAIKRYFSFTSSNNYLINNTDRMLTRILISKLDPAVTCICIKLKRLIVYGNCLPNACVCWFSTEWIIADIQLPYIYFNTNQISENDKIY